MPRVKFYGVARGRVPGVYRTWDEASAQVTRFRGAEHKSFSSFAEAEAWVASRNPSFREVEARRSDPAPGSPRGATSPRAAHRRGVSTRAGSTAAPSDAHPRDADAVSDDATDIPAADRNPSAPAPLRESPCDASATPPLNEGSYTLYFDGACRGNPGPSGAGALIRRDADDRVIFELAEYLGDDKTNNEAEYLALLRGLSKAADLGICHLDVKGDSSLVVNQVNGAWKVKKEHLVPLWRTARDIIDANFPSFFRASHVDRERNAEADALANTAITVGSQVGAGANVAPRGGFGRTGEAAARETGGGGGGGGGTGGAEAAASWRMRGAESARAMSGAEASRPRAFRAIRRGGEDIGRPIALGVVRAMSSSATGTKRPAPFDARDRARTERVARESAVSSLSPSRSPPPHAHSPPPRAHSPPHARSHRRFEPSPRPPPPPFASVTLAGAFGGVWTPPFPPTRASSLGSRCRARAGSTTRTVPWLKRRPTTSAAFAPGASWVSGLRGALRVARVLVA